MKKAKNRTEAPMTETQGYAEILQIAKRGNPAGASRALFYWGLQHGAARIQKATETAEQAFARFVETEPDGMVLFKAYQSASGPAVVEDEDDDENEAAEATKDKKRKLPPGALPPSPERKRTPMDADVIAAHDRKVSELTKGGLSRPQALVKIAEDPGYRALWNRYQAALKAASEVPTADLAVRPLGQVDQPGDMDRAAAQAALNARVSHWVKSGKAKDRLTALEGIAASRDADDERAWQNASAAA